MADKKTSPSPPGIIAMFETFRAELDEHHDRKERVVKASRDITALSKKIIFSLQRSRGFPLHLDTKDENTINTQWDSISKLSSSVQPDLQGINGWRYFKQISPGLQELVEALTFQRFLMAGLLPAPNGDSFIFPVLGPDTKQPDPKDPTKRATVSENDYILGLCDLTGEMMRFAITSMATNRKLLPTYDVGSPETAEQRSNRNILTDLRALGSQLELLSINAANGAHTPLMNELQKKLEVTKASIGKVEGAAYGLAIRGRERPKGWMPDSTAIGGAGHDRAEVESY